MHRDLMFGSATLALAAGYYLMAAAIPQSLLADAVGPQGLPRIYAFLLAGFSLILIIRSLPRAGGRGKGEGGAFRLSTTRPDASQEAGAQRHVLYRVAGLLTIGVVYIAVVPWLGYMLSIAGLIVATTYYQGSVVNRQVVVVAVSGAVVFWVLFVLLLRIPHPPGVWPSLF